MAEEHLMVFEVAGLLPSVLLVALHALIRHFHLAAQGA